MVLGRCRNARDLFILLVLIDIHVFILIDVLNFIHECQWRREWVRKYMNEWMNEWMMSELT